jgi:hypothetical protein
MRRQIQTNARGPKNRLALVLLACALALVLWGVGPHLALADDDAELGAFTCDFGLAGTLSLGQAVPILERDRLYMSARPGFLHKHVPLSVDLATGNVFAGGRYLFDSVEHAEEYKFWVQNDFILDGVEFFNRPYFLNPECHAWSVIGAQDFGDIHTRQVVVRTERWMTPEQDQRVVLEAHWQGIRTEAQQRGLTSIWLLHNEQERLVSLVSFADRVGPPDPSQPDFASLFALADARSLGHPFDAAGWGKRFDRTQWVFTIWFPFETGDTGEPSVWPNSPPFPRP